MKQQLQPRLVVEGGVQGVSVIPLDKPVHILRKLPDPGIIIDNPFVSRRHAEVRLIDGQYHIRDLGSKNGTFVNGTRLGNTGVRLKSGDKIELVRDQVVLRFQERTNTMTFPPPSDAASSGALAVDVPSRDVYVQGTRVDPPLTRKEFDVLQCLFAHLGQACSKGDIASQGWPERQKGDVGDNEIDQCIRRIRLRIERDPSNPRYLLTMRGYGYKLSM